MGFAPRDAHDEPRDESAQIELRIEPIGKGAQVMLNKSDTCCPKSLVPLIRDRQKRSEVGFGVELRSSSSLG